MVVGATATILGAALLGDDSAVGKSKNNSTHGALLGDDSAVGKSKKNSTHAKGAVAPWKGQQWQRDRKKCKEVGRTPQSTIPPYFLDTLALAAHESDMADLVTQESDVADSAFVRRMEKEIEGSTPSRREYDEENEEEEEIVHSSADSIQSLRRDYDTLAMDQPSMLNPVAQAVAAVLEKHSQSAADEEHEGSGDVLLHKSEMAYGLAVGARVTDVEISDGKKNKKRETEVQEPSNHVGYPHTGNPHGVEQQQQWMPNDGEEAGAEPQTWTEVVEEPQREDKHAEGVETCRDAVFKGGVGGATNHSYGGGESGQDEGDCCGDNEDEEQPQRGEAVFKSGIDETMNHNYGGDVGGSHGGDCCAMVKMKWRLCDAQFAMLAKGACKESHSLCILTHSGSRANCVHCTPESPSPRMAQHRAVLPLRARMQAN